ncbi:MAG: nucleotidyl transferase family protein, partial [Rhodospirillaceae bacterium]
PRIAFVWLMGADNLADISRWWRWTGIFRAARVAVFDRSPYSYKALAGCAAHRFSRARHPAKCLWPHTPPAWSYIAMRRHPASATALRLAAKAKRTKP